MFSSPERVWSKQIALALAVFFNIVAAARENGANMEELTCPNCNVDVDKTELRQNRLRCPTCGYDFSETEDVEELEEDAEEDEDEEDDEKD
jgi:uncharacterized Zn finger protein (UPF0148 family)